eukprot:Sspe_Gene.113007::Locus_96870_Transcript_1_2_Confidence_0.500_Length_1005::g.113007::m.113007
MSDGLAHLPVVDLESPDAAKAVREACESTGFFYLTGHGVGDRTVAEMFEAAAQFFASTDEKKMECLASEKTGNRGYTPMGEEVLDPEQQTQGDTKEGYYIGREPCASDAGNPLAAPNVWPSHLPGWRDVMQEYLDAMIALGHRVVRLIAESLGLPADHFDQHFRYPTALLRLLRYAPVPSSPGDGVYGAGAHTDYGMITLLAISGGAPGLELHLDGKWVCVPALPGAFVVNLGDMLQRWTNDLYRSTLHRVVNRKGEERYSAPFFFEPSFDARVECLPQFCSEDRPAKYPPTTAGEHLLQKYRETHNGFKG